MVHRGLSRSVGLLLWLLGRRRRYRLTGESMRPTLAPGETVLVDPRAYRAEAPRTGDVVLVRHPYRRDVQMVKRVRRVLPDGRCILGGDNAADSTDSRAFGPVPASLVAGRVLLSPAARPWETPA